MRIRLLSHVLWVGVAGLSLSQLGSVAAAADPPDLDPAIYGHVVHVGWVVSDLEPVLDHWERLGLRGIQRRGVIELPDVTYRGQPAPTRLKMASVDVGDVSLSWAQPIGGENVYTAFLKSHGDGIHHLAYAVPSAARLERELEYFASRDVGVVQRGSWQGQAGKGLFAYLDTAERGGGLTIELTYDPDRSPTPGPESTEHEPPFDRVVQYGFVVRDLDEVNTFYQSLGFPDLGKEHNIFGDREYQGRPSEYEMYVGWDRRGDVPLEWIQTKVGPNTYEDHFETYGEGFHHLAFRVADMDAAIAAFEAKGFKVSMGGSWDFPNTRGRYMYLDTERIGGVATELLWNAPRESP